MRPLRPLLLALLLLALAPVAPAGASQLIDRDARGLTLGVDRSGRAMLTYTARGRLRHVLAWGGLNARPSSQTARQVAFRLDYSGGWGTWHKNVWKTFRNVCGPYHGPQLPWFVLGCTAPDGTHWAIQSWQRMLPNYGLRPTREQALWELRLSHFSGALPQLTVNANWAYRRYDHLFGSFTYRGDPVFGYASTSVGNPLDRYGRNVYVDTFDSVYGGGWRRENSFLTHVGTGTFCYGFYPHGNRPEGRGTRYRATVIGPGVTPDVMWEGTPLGEYNRELDLQLHELQRSLYGPDRACRPV